MGNVRNKLCFDTIDSFVGKKKLTLSSPKLVFELRNGLYQSLYQMLFAVVAHELDVGQTLL